MGGIEKDPPADAEDVYNAVESLRAVAEKISATFDKLVIFVFCFGGMTALASVIAILCWAFG